LSDGPEPRTGRRRGDGGASETIDNTLQASRSGEQRTRASDGGGTFEGRGGNVRSG